MLWVKQGFAFSLDSFVAFSLMLIAVQSIVVISSTPSGYYSSLMQANLLSSGTLDVLSNVKIESENREILSYAVEAAISADPTRAYRLAKVTNELIPRPFSYTYDYYDFETKRWKIAYNASDHGCNFLGSEKFCNVTFSRVQASSMILVGTYADAPDAGESPYCNVNCKGYDSSTKGYTQPEMCTKTPCDIQIASTFYPGDYHLGLLRLRVWG